MPKKSGAKPSGYIGVIAPIKEGRKWVLKSLSAGMVNPIGARLHRLTSWPLDSDTFSTQEEAQRAADQANNYLGAKL
jgi:hypothetical protein